MGKRKHSRSKDSEYDRILRKVKKLESKLNKRRRLSSSESSQSDQSLKTYYDNTHGYENEGNVQGDTEVPDEFIGVYDNCQLNADVGTAEPIAGPSTLLAAPESTQVLLPEATIANTDKVDLTNDDIRLDPEILQLLGVDPTEQKDYGEDLHKDIASRWAHILANGLSKETQLEMIKCYLTPANCTNIRAPKLNLEIKAALSETYIKKDLFSQHKQNQLGCSLAAIGRALNWALSSNNSAVPQDIIKALSDAGRLLCDSHHRESLSRRYAALSTLNKNIRDAVKNTCIDEHLFGSALAEHIKSSKAIFRTGSEIKQKPKRPAYRNSAITQPRGALNSRGAPPRVVPVAEPRQTPAPRRPPRDRRLEATRGRRTTNNARQQPRRRY